MSTDALSTDATEPGDTTVDTGDENRNSAERSDDSGEIRQGVTNKDGTDFDKLPPVQNQPVVKPVGNKDDRNRKWKIFGLCLAVFLILFIIILILFFQVDTGGAARAFEDTFPPTLGTTEAPTTLTESPTPLIDATEAPTITPRNPLLSRLPCDEIRVQENVTIGHYGENNFKNYSFGEVQICGDTYGAKDSQRPNRNEWSVRRGRRDCPSVPFDAHVELCDFVGARLCTRDEYFAGVATGTGCGGDRQFVWTATECRENGVLGNIMFDLGLRDPREATTKCETDYSTKSLMRCCGDNYVVEG